MPRAQQQKRRSTLGSIWARRDRWAAKYARDGQWHTPGETFSTFRLADQWLCDEQRLIDRDEWTPPAQRRAEAEAAELRAEQARVTLGEYAAQYVETRRVRSGDPLAPRTRAEYQSYLTGTLAGLAARQLTEITSADVERWWAANDDKRTLRHHAYAFLKQVMAYAMTDRGGALIVRNPCQVENASFRSRLESEAARDQRIVNLTPAGVAALADAVVPRWRMFVLLLAYTAMRPGEALALTRRDLTCSERDGLPCWVLSVSAAATTAVGDDGRPVRVIGATKTAGSVRYVYLPPHLASELEAHLDAFAAPGKDGLIFPSARDPRKVATVAQVWGSTASKRQAASGFRAARIAIGSPDLTIYDLRRWGRKLLRQAGMTDLDVEQYMGHVLGRVTDAYAVVDPEIVWPVIVRASELAGWVRPSTAPAAGLPIPARLLNAMTGPQLAAALAAMDPEQLSAVVPHLAPDTLARVFAAGVLEGVRERG